LRLLAHPLQGQAYEDGLWGQASIGELRPHPVKSEFRLQVLIPSGEQFMAQVCDICGKGPQFGNNISHAHNVTKRRWNVNLRPVRAKVGGATKRIRVCTSCLRSGKVVKA
jgi:large subunit ribosomal protein L28